MALKAKASEQLEAKVKALGKLPENRACVNCGSKVGDPLKRAPMAWESLGRKLVIRAVAVELNLG